MKPLSKYDIPFVGLKNGSHHFVYHIDNSFFEHFEHSMIQIANVDVNLLFDKGNSLFELTFEITGTVQTECDRCTEIFDLPIVGKHGVMVKFSNELAQQDSIDDEIVYISHNDTHVNVAQLIYEFITLSLPMQRFHPNDAAGKPTCNIEWLIQQEKEKTESIDPRWAALQALKKNKN